MNANSDKISVLLVDDSSIIRSALRRILHKDESIDIVGCCSDGESAITQAKVHQPDVIILDVEMPIMDGLTALPQILEVSPKSKVVMFSTLTSKGAEASMKAFSLGAVECLEKPSAQDKTQYVDKGEDFATKLLRLIHSLAPTAEHDVASKIITDTPIGKPNINASPHNFQGPPSIIAIGSSTGGPNALFEVCKHLKDVNMPIVITQHMPATFTKILAKHLHEKTGIAAFEGEDGMPLENNAIYVAPGGYHMIFSRNDSDQTVIRLNDGPRINFCKPAIDPMFESLIPIYNNKILAVILTGMGSDGLNGSAKVIENKGYLIAQDRATCTVWGMPRAVEEAGLCHTVLPVHNIGPHIHTMAKGK